MESLSPFAYWIAAVFCIGYLAIILEEMTHINKTTTALFMAVVCWVILFAEPDVSAALHLDNLSVQMFKVSQVIFFLLGALIIVEIINVHNGFQFITKYLFVDSKRKLLWLVGLVTFFMSAVLDNLTTTIVMVSILNKLLDQPEDRLLIGGGIVIAANAGGAWTPIGDIATTLLWINNEVTTFPLIINVFPPSFACLLTYLFLTHYQFKGPLPVPNQGVINQDEIKPYGKLILFLGIAGMIFVPFFHMWTNLPAFMGMMLSVAILWLVTDKIHSKTPDHHFLSIPAILPRVDLSILLFYLGLLLSINALDSAGLLKALAELIRSHFSHPTAIAILIGLASSLVDNVSLVAATIGMYGVTTFQPNDPFWELLAYTAGTGGSIFIIGSAAGVALMALNKANFTTYAKVIGPRALAGYFVGVGVYLLVQRL